MNVRILITRDGSNKVRTLEIEEYLRGVVCREMSEGWPLEALKAQAVAARTYAVAHVTGRGTYDMDDTTKYQAYVGPGEHQPHVDEAVRSTAGQVLMYQDNLITAYYAASNGGRTYSSQEVWGGVRGYLIAQPDPWDAASGYKKNGHGVGMSQRGAQWAANHGIKYQEILKFYFHNTELVGNYGKPVVAPPPPPKPPVPPPQPKPPVVTYHNYTVKKGDSLSKIAAGERKKGYKVTWTQIASLNKIKVPWIIRPGQVLKIPNTK